MRVPVFPVATLLVCGVLADGLVAMVRTGTGGAPAITLSVVTALALIAGPYRGMLWGFAAGVVLDLLAGPAVGGVYALGGIVTGAVAGVAGRRAPLRLRARPVIGVVVVPGVLLGALTLHGMLGQPAMSFAGALQWSVVCGMLMTPLVARLVTNFTFGHFRTMSHTRRITTEV